MTINGSFDQPPPPPATSGGDDARLAAGGIYIKWQERLWQEQPDGNYLVWNEASHTWEKSQRQPPREGSAVETKECSSCRRRIKKSFRVCPHCGFAFPREAQKPGPTARALAPQPWYHKPVPGWVTLVLGILVLVGSLAVVYRLVQRDPCASWAAGNAALARNAAIVQGEDPEGAELDRLIERYENRFGDSKPEGC